jgi:hypothetical protein
MHADSIGHIAAEGTHMARVPSIAGLCMLLPLATVSCAASGLQESTPATAAVAPGVLSSGSAGLAPFVSDPSRIRMERRGDLDGDGDEDVLLVLAPPPGADARFDPRTLLVLLRGADGKLAKAVDNPAAIPCERCGGMMGDPLQDIAIGNSGFTLRLEGGSRELWSQTFRFDYSRKDAMWMLVSIEEGGADRATGNAAGKRRSAEDFGAIPLDRFSIDEFPADALS